MIPATDNLIIFKNKTFFGNESLTYKCRRANGFGKPINCFNCVMSPKQK